MCTQSALQRVIRWTVGVCLSLGGVAAHAQLTVSPLGTPIYSYPIVIPPGVSGVQPSLNLAYAGSGINGPVGHGWSVQGVSMITRCSATRFTDGKPRGVKFDKDDKLCLDGQRLIQTTSTGSLTDVSQSNDALGLSTGYREYRTENDSFARIRAYGIANDSAANGPAYFKVWSKSGLIYEYGASPSADSNTKSAVAAQGKSVIMVWGVSRMSDVIGNYVDFKYEQRANVLWGSGSATQNPLPGLEWNITEIQYTGHVGKSQKPSNKVIFKYSDRSADRAEAYQVGSKNISVRRLDAIDTYVNSPNPGTLGPASGAVVAKRVQISYDNSGTSKRSRIVAIKECRDVNAGKCLPPTRFTYTSGGSDAYAINPVFSTSALATTNLMGNASAAAGVLPGDFDGDGKTDLFYWSDTPAQNRLYRSVGDGGFSQSSALPTVQIFKSDGCYESISMDFNGDGATDILRIAKATAASGGSCAVPLDNLLLLSNGDGTFRSVALPASIDFSQTTATIRYYYDCLQPRSSGYFSNCLEPGDKLLGTSRTEGRNYFIVDVDGDGIQDIITTLLPAYARTASPPSDDAACASVTCTRVFKGSVGGTFSENTTGNLTHASVYAYPPGRWNYLRRPYVADINGDGLPDLLVSKGAWLSRGDASGSFDKTLGLGGGLGCANPIDFNGDGRADCLERAYSASAQSLTIGDGSAAAVTAANFNLKSTGHELFAINGDWSVTADVFIADFNGDGRQDILRWKDAATDNVLYLSNGDGTFSTSGTFNLGGTSAVQLQHSDGTSLFIVADFAGKGNPEILRLETKNGVVANRLYQRVDPILPDMLTAVISPTGLKTALSYDYLSNTAAGRYSSDRNGNYSAKYPVVDIPSTAPIIVSMVSDTGVGSAQLRSEYAYYGLKGSLDGGGAMGFRQTVQQTTAANGEPVSLWQDYLLNEPYAGMVRLSERRRGAWDAPGAPLLSRVVHTYCDRTSGTKPADASDVTPCATSAKVRRPYLYKTVESGYDLDGTALPTVTTINTFDDWGNPSAISVTTTGAFAGATRTYKSDTVNDFCAPDAQSCPNTVADDRWILGRLKASTVTNTVPDLLFTLGASAGNAPLATATTGSSAAVLSLSNCISTTPTAPAAAKMTCALSNIGLAAVTSISYTSGAGTSVTTGPTGSCDPNKHCGTVVLTSTASAGSYGGTLKATPKAGVAAVQGYDLKVLTPAALAFENCRAVDNTTTPATASLTCLLRNTGQTTAGSIAYTAYPTDTTVAGPTGACAPGAACGSVTVTTGTAAAVYSGTLTATPDSGTAASQAVNLTVKPAAALFSYVGMATVVGKSAVTVTFTFRNDYPAPVSVSKVGFSGSSGLADITGGTCSVGSSLAYGANCTIVVLAERGCGGYSYKIAVALSNAAGTRLSATYTVPKVTSGQSCLSAEVPSDPDQGE